MTEMAQAGTQSRRRAGSNRPEVALIMPCYNPGPEIAWTLDSLRAQTLPFRLFVTDDGSTIKPDYRQLLAGFDHELIELPENVGVCTVRNQSVERALLQGFEFIAIIDCGDWAHPERLERQLQYLKSHPGIAALGTAVEVLDHNGDYAHDYYPPQDPAGIRASLFYGLAFKHPSMMFRAAVFKEIGLYSPDYQAAEDYELVRRAAVAHDLANLPVMLLKKVESLNSVSATRRTAQLLSRLRIQWRYRQLSSPHFWLGLLKTLIVLVVPTKWVKRIQPLIYAKRAPRLDVAQEDGGP